MAELKSSKVHLYDLPCFPDKKPRDDRRTSVDLHTNFCGSPGHMVFIGGGGHARFDTEKEARDAVTRLVLAELTYRRDRLKEQLDYAQDLLDRWDRNPEVFSARTNGLD